MRPVEITRLLDKVAGGDRDSADRLFVLVYDELKKLARAKMKSEAASHTLQSTALVHEIWIKIVGGRDDPNWKNREHFFAAAAQAMRRVLVDSARTRQAQIRGGGKKKHQLREDDRIIRQDIDLIALDEAMKELQKLDSQKAKLVSLRYFAGLTNAEAAQQLGVSVATAERYWAFARAWLRMKIEG